jgi:xanthine dehydrogenase YagR molybdenum-binding subunit
MGMGTATVQLQHAAERLGLPIGNVSFHYGDSRSRVADRGRLLPDHQHRLGRAGGDGAAAPAVDRSRRALATARSPDRPRRNTELRDGGVYRTDDRTSGESFTAILRRAGKDKVAAETSAPMPKEMRQYSMGSYGAQFCEVRVREDSGEVRVSRWVGSFDCGRIVNYKTATSQLRGGIVMGMGWR